MRVFTIAILLLVLLPANALARPATVDEARYYGRIEAMVSIMSPSLERATNLLADPVPLDPEWQTNLIVETRLWSAVYQAHLGMAVPPAFSDFDVNFSESLESADLAAKGYERAVTSQNPSDVRAANNHLTEAGDSLEQALANLPDLDFPASAAQATSEPEEEFSTPLNLDASCDATHLTPTVRVSRLGTSVVVSGGGVAFTCFDVEPGEWEMNFACIGDPTGAAMFGTTLKDTIFLSPGVVRSITIDEPIEAKLLMTCLHKWTYQITKQ